MKLPRASMTTTLFVILVFAVDFGVARDLLTNVRDVSGFGLGLLPMATVLVFGAYRLARLRTLAGTFTVGFVAVGLASTVAYVATIRLVDAVADWLDQGLDRLEAGLMAMVPASWAELDPILGVTEWFALVLVLSLPPFLAALAGGWLARRFARGGQADSRRRKQPRAWKRPRFTLASASFLLAVLAVDFGVVRLMGQEVRFGPNPDRPISPSGPWLGFVTPWGLAVVARWVLFAVGFLPMANLLALGLPGALRARSRPGSFLLGFEVVGWLATVACLAACAFAPDFMIKGFEVFGVAVNGAIDLVFGQGQAQRFWMNASHAGLAVAVLLCAAFFTLPALVAALSGGAISRRLGRKTSAA